MTRVRGLRVHHPGSSTETGARPPSGGRAHGPAAPSAVLNSLQWQLRPSPGTAPADRQDSPSRSTRADGFPHFIDRRPPDDKVHARQFVACGFRFRPYWRRSNRPLRRVRIARPHHHRTATGAGLQRRHCEPHQIAILLAAPRAGVAQSQLNTACRKVASSWDGISSPSERARTRPRRGGRCRPVADPQQRRTGTGATRRIPRP